MSTSDVSTRARVTAVELRTSTPDYLHIHGSPTACVARVTFQARASRCYEGERSGSLYPRSWPLPPAPGEIRISAGNRSTRLEQVGSHTIWQSSGQPHGFHNRLMFHVWRRLTSSPEGTEPDVLQARVMQAAIGLRGSLTGDQFVRLVELADYQDGCRLRLLLRFDPAERWTWNDLPQVPRRRVEAPPHPA